MRDLRDAIAAVLSDGVEQDFADVVIVDRSLMKALASEFAVCFVEPEDDGDFQHFQEKD